MRSIGWLAVSVALVSFATPAWACLYIPPSYKATGSSFSDLPFTLVPTPYGSGFSQDGAIMAYNHAAKKWCLATEDAPRNFDCDIMNKPGAGQMTRPTGTDENSSIFIKNSAGKILGVIIYGRLPGQMLMFSVKPEINNQKDPANVDVKDFIDRSKSWLSLRPESVDANGKVERSLSVELLTRDGALGKTMHKQAGKSLGEGKMEMPTSLLRSIAPVTAAKPSADGTKSLAGVDSVVGSVCGDDTDERPFNSKASARGRSGSGAGATGQP